jgi:hypothetical protein
MPMTAPIPALIAAPTTMPIAMPDPVSRPFGSPLIEATALAGRITTLLPALHDSERDSDGGAKRVSTRYELQDG